MLGEQERRQCPDGAPGRRKVAGPRRESAAGCADVAERMCQWEGVSATPSLARLGFTAAGCGPGREWREAAARQKPARPSLQPLAATPPPSPPLPTPPPQATPGKCRSGKCPQKLLLGAGARMGFSWGQCSKGCLEEQGRMGQRAREGLCKGEGLQRAGSWLSGSLLALRVLYKTSVCGCQ